MMVGSVKTDIKMIRQAAKSVGINSNESIKAFGDFVESIKRSNGMPNNYHFSWKELVELAKEFLG